mgnify:CR=1 FL=1
MEDRSMIRPVTSADRAVLRELLAEHKIMTILVKGSRSAAMEEVVRALQETGTC